MSQCSNCLHKRTCGLEEISEVECKHKIINNRDNFLIECNKFKNELLDKEDCDFRAIAPVCELYNWIVEHR